MAKLASIVELELLPEVTPEEFARFIAEEFTVMQAQAGVWVASCAAIKARVLRNIS